MPGTKARCIICAENPKEIEYTCRQPGYKAGKGVHCRSTVVRWANCKQAHRAISNKCEIARKAREEGRRTGNSGDQRNLDRIERREDGKVESDEIEPFGNTPLESEDSGPDEVCDPGMDTDSEAESETSSDSRPSVEMNEEEEDNKEGIARAERVRRHIFLWLRKNLLNK
jgi:hypothetical protein